MPVISWPGEQVLTVNMCVIDHGWRVRHRHNPLPRLRARTHDSGVPTNEPLQCVSGMLALVWRVDRPTRCRKTIQPLFINTVWMRTALSIPADRRSQPRPPSRWSASTCLWNTGTGKEVQQAHMALGEQDRSWPEPGPPADSHGEITVQAVLDAIPDDKRTRIIESWAESVWQTWESSHQWVKEVCGESLDIDR